MVYKIIAGLLVIVSSACAPTVQTSSSSSGPKQTAGTLSGMVIGGALANDMAGDSKNKGIATILGAFVGGVVGQNIALPILHY